MKYWWMTADRITRAAVAITVVALVLLVMPLFSIPVALAGAVLASLAVRRALRSGGTNVVAAWCLVLDVLILLAVIIGSAWFAIRS